MDQKQETTSTPSQPSASRRLLRSMMCIGHPKLKPWLCWMFFIPQLILYLYWLGPVFVYYFHGVPPEESLESITGIWRQEGTVTADPRGLAAPKYFIDTLSGPREMHFGFPSQMGSGVILPQQGRRVIVHYDSYFGILAFEYPDNPDNGTKADSMTYQEGVYFYGRPRNAIYRNYGAHIKLAVLVVAYCLVAMLCWKAQKAAR